MDGAHKAVCRAPPWAAFCPAKEEACWAGRAYEAQGAFPWARRRGADQMGDSNRPDRLVPPDEEKMDDLVPVHRIAADASAGRGAAHWDDSPGDQMAKVRGFP